MIISAIINNKRGIYELPKDLRLRILGNYKISGMGIGLELDWNALFHVDEIVEKKNQINECIIQVLAHINRYV